MARARNTSSSSESDSGKTVKAVVLVDSYSWHEESNNPSSPRHDAPPLDETGLNPSAKGVEIEVSAEEFERGSNMRPPALAKKGSDAAKHVNDADAAELPRGQAVSDLSDSDLKAIAVARGVDVEGKTRDELVGLVVGTPDAPRP